MRVLRQIDDHFVNSVALLLRRMGAVEAWRNAQQHPDISFSEPGATSTGDFPPTAFPAGAGLAVGLVVILGTAGTSTSTYQIKKNGSAVTGTSLSLSSGTALALLPFTTPVAFVGPYSDIVVPTCTAAGTGAKDATVLVQWRPAT